MIAPELSPEAVERMHAQMPAHCYSIAFVTESLGAGGAERQMIELIKRLDKQKFDIRVLTYFPDHFYEKELEGLSVRHYFHNRKGKLDLRPAFILAKWLQTGDVQLVHSYLSTANFYAALAGKIARRGRVITSERSQWHLEGGLSRIHGKWAYRHSDLVIANSDATRQAVRRLQLDEKRTKFIPNGLDFTKFRPIAAEAKSAFRKQLGLPSEAKIFLTVASFKGQKNHQGIIDALSELDETKRGANTLFLWVGAQSPAENFREIQEEIAASDQTNTIRLLGPREDVVNLYQASDVVVLNSLWEGTPNVVLEAMACGRPVIATDVSDARRYVIDNKTGWLIPPNDPSSLRQAIIEAVAMSNDDLNRLGAAGRQHMLSLEMDSASLARRHEEIYLTLLEKNKAD